MKTKKFDKCEICGTELVYAIAQKDYKILPCDFCSKEYKANTYCPNGHYICDECHANEPISIIRDYCKTTDKKDPFEIADIIMKHPKFNLYGPEHHVLTPAVILTALKNNGVKKPDGSKILNEDIDEAIRRASKIPGGWCGFYGSCGSGMGSGVAISIFTGATPAKDKQRTLANKMTSRSLNKIADDLEHCCKRSVKISICESLDFLKEKFQIDLDYNPNKCSFSEANPKCEKVRCTFN